jgi:hypothetical protein
MELEQQSVWQGLLYTTQSEQPASSTPPLATQIGFRPAASEPLRLIPLVRFPVTATRGPHLGSLWRLPNQRPAGAAAKRRHLRCCIPDVRRIYGDATARAAVDFPTLLTEIKVQGIGIYRTTSCWTQSYFLN